jgi:mannitol 2-dehydrogenase
MTSKQSQSPRDITLLDYNSSKKMQLLTTKTLSLFNAGLSYKRDVIKPGIIHFSPGNFHRTHQCSSYNDLFEYAAKHGADENDPMFQWGIVGASTRNGSYGKLQPIMTQQDCLYTLVEADDDSTNANVMGSIIDMLPYKDDHQPIKEKLMDENIKIVSMTVTEGGYFVDTNNEFDKNDDAIQYDAKNPDDPRTVFGLIVQALRQRREKNMKPFNVMACDNVPQNGAVARQATVGLASLIDKDLGQWIDDHVAFPCSMVDRITPEPTEELKNSVDLDYDDGAIIFSEPFHQWVVEDNFCNDRPPLEKVGVKFVKDVEPWEEAKLRILNAGHASMCYPAHIMGIKYVDEAMGNEAIYNFLDKLQKEEIVPLVPAVPNTDMSEYWETIKNRYQNSKLSDSIQRNCENGSDRQTKFILPTIRDCFKDEDHKLDGLALVSAMWCKYCLGETEDGEVIDGQDERWDALHETAQKCKDDPNEWLKMKEIYDGLGNNKKFQSAFEKAFSTCIDKGVEAAMKEYVDE